MFDKEVSKSKLKVVKIYFNMEKSSKANLGITII